MNLKKILAESGLTQQNVADDLGISPQAVNNYVHEKREPSIEMLIKLADYFNVSVDYLIGRDVPTEKPLTGKTVVSGNGQAIALDPDKPITISVNGKVFEIALAEDKE